MANRDLSNFREVQRVITEPTSDLIPAVAKLGQDIIRQSQEAKIVENMSAAQLDLNKLTNEFQTQYEGDPFNEQGIKEFREKRAAVLESYGSNISPMFGRAWKENASKLANQNDLMVNAWGYKQADVNSIFSINTSIKNNLEGAMISGGAYASGAMSEAEALLAFEQNYETLRNYGTTNLGETTTAKFLEDYRGDYLLNFISGVSDSNPYKAMDILNNEKFSDGISLVNRKRLEGHIEAKIEKINRAARADASLKEVDPAGWGEQHGLDVEQIASMQEGYVDIIGNKKAKSYAEIISKTESPQEIVNFANQIKQEYGGYANNALGKIASNLSPDKASALNIAINSDPEYYAEQVNLLTELSRYKDTDLEKEYKATVMENPDLIDDVVFEETSRPAQAMRNEGKSAGALPYINQTARLAKLYRIKNPTMSVDDSVKFANQYTNDKYFFGKANDTEFRIPSQLDDGTILSTMYADKIASKLKEQIPKTEMKVGSADVVRKQDVSPFLNPSQDGVWFRTPENILVTNSSGNPSEIKFKALLDLSPEEVAKLEKKRKVSEIEKLPYRERDAARRKAFGL